MNDSLSPDKNKFFMMILQYDDNRDDEDLGVMIADTLRDVGEAIETWGPHDGTITGPDGNTVGTWSVVDTTPPGLDLP